MSKSSIYLLIIGFTIAYYLIHYATGKHVAADKEDKILLKFPPFLKILSIVFMGISVMGLFAFFYFEEEPFEIAAIVMITFLNLVSAYLCLLTRNHYVRFDDETVEMRNSLGRVSTVKWAEVVDVGFLGYLGFIKLKDKYGKRVYIHHYLRGLGQFLNKFEAKTKWSRTSISLTQRNSFR